VLSGEAISSFEITLDGVVVVFDGFFWRCSRAASPKDCAWLAEMSSPVKTEISTRISNFRMVLPLEDIQNSSNPWYAGNGEDQGYISVWLRGGLWLPAAEISPNGARWTGKGRS
jgi:hypothetical protein